MSSYLTISSVAGHAPACGEHPNGVVRPGPARGCGLDGEESKLLADAFTAAGYTVVHPFPEPGEYGVMIASRVAARPDAFAERLGYLPARAAAATLPTPAGPIRLIGLYVPSRDAGLESLEYECEVSDRAQMHQAILAMGFAPTVRIVKRRRTAASGGLAVCLDDVDHAGVFLELERLVGPGESGTAAQTDLDAFARALGAPLERTPDTYDSLVRAALAEPENLASP
jgi:adenylate cyclase class 2